MSSSVKSAALRFATTVFFRLTETLADTSAVVERKVDCLADSGEPRAGSGLRPPPRDTRLAESLGHPAAELGDERGPSRIVAVEKHAPRIDGRARLVERRARQIVRPSRVASLQFERGERQRRRLRRRDARRAPPRGVESQRRCRPGSWRSSHAGTARDNERPRQSLVAAALVSAPFAASSRPIVQSRWPSLIPASAPTTGSSTSAASIPVAASSGRIGTTDRPRTPGTAGTTMKVSGSRPPSMVTSKRAGGGHRLLEAKRGIAGESQERALRQSGQQTACPGRLDAALQIAPVAHAAGQRRRGEKPGALGVIGSASLDEPKLSPVEDAGRRAGRVVGDTPVAALGAKCSVSSANAAAAKIRRGRSAGSASIHWRPDTSQRRRNWRPASSPACAICCTASSKCPAA